jgi:hypothetical protein
MNATRANFTGLNDGLHAEEISWEEYLAVLSGPELADAKLVPYEYKPGMEPAQPVTLTEGLNNGRQ